MQGIDELFEIGGPGEEVAARVTTGLADAGTVDRIHAHAGPSHKLATKTFEVQPAARETVMMNDDLLRGRIAVFGVSQLPPVGELDAAAGVLHELSRR